LPEERQDHEGSLSPRLHRRDLVPDPLAQFQAWFAEAERSGTPAPEATALATATPAAAPSVRMVLLRGASPDGFRFFTGYSSRKAGELDANPQAALLWHWRKLGRQVRVEGTVSRLPEADADAYFASRPRESRLGTWASEQGAVLSGRDQLEQALAEARQRFAGADVPRPERWGGYLISPVAYEFWQHGENRLHDRFRYRRDDAGDWVIERLAP
jgi:pyridoxamine 5'-phosphate oxidase